LLTHGGTATSWKREGLKEERYNLRLPLPTLWCRDSSGSGCGAPGATVGARAARGELARRRHRCAQGGKPRRWPCAICTPIATRPMSRAAARARAGSARVFISLSSEILPQIKEFVRVSTTSVTPISAARAPGYFHQAEAAPGGLGYRQELFIILSHGGWRRWKEAVRLGRATGSSGRPRQGGRTPRRRALGIQRLIAFDMGGTSTDISLVSQGEAALTGERGLAGQRIACAASTSSASAPGRIEGARHGPISNVGRRAASTDPARLYGRAARPPR